MECVGGQDPRADAVLRILRNCYSPLGMTCGALATRTGLAPDEVAACIERLFARMDVYPTLDAHHFAAV